MIFNKNKRNRSVIIIIVLSLLPLVGCKDDGDTDKFESTLFGTDNSGSTSTNTDSNVIEVEPNNSFTSANLITNEVTGQKDYSDSYDYFKVVATSSSMTVSLTHITPNSPTSDFTVHIYDHDQNELDYFNAYNGINNSKTIGVISGETYFVKVDVYAAGSADQYKLSVGFSSQSYELEPNDDFATAQTVTAGVDYIGQRNGYESYDYFKVIAAGSTMTVNLSHVTQNSPTSDFTVYIYNISQTELDYSNVYDGINRSRTIGVVSGNTYYFKIYVGGAGSADQYKLNVSYGTGNYELEPNDSYPEAQSITPGVDYIGQRNGGDYYDFFKVTATGSSMTVDLSHVNPNSSTSNYTVYIYDYNQTQLDYFYAYNGISASKTVTVISGATYYVKVYIGSAGDSDQYKLKVSF